MYAERFVERFAHVEGHWEEPLIEPGRHPHQNIAGNAYRGCNRTFLPLVATFKGYRLPLWMTVAQMRELSVWPLKGTSGVPVSFTDVAVKDASSGGRSRYSPEEYDAMAPWERQERNLRKVFMTRWYRVFNICQTTFGEMYPDSMAELGRFFGAEDGARMDSDPLDSLVSEDGWLCPIRVDSGCRNPGYDRDSDSITVPPKTAFCEDRAYYGTLLRAMARSTGSEMRLDRGIWSDLGGDAAIEALVSELSAASMGALLGIGVTMDRGSERYLKSWLDSVSASPDLIYDAVREAARATDCLCSAMELEPVRGVDVTRLMARHEAEKAGIAGKTVDGRRENREGTVRLADVHRRRGK